MDQIEVYALKVKEWHILFGMVHKWLLIQKSLIIFFCSAVTTFSDVVYGRTVSLSWPYGIDMDETRSIGIIVSQWLGY